MIRNFLILLGCVLSLSCAQVAKLNPLATRLPMTRPEPTEPAELIFEMKADKAQPIQFSKHETMKLSSSGSFSEKGARYLAKLSEVVTVIDLRQESHGLINGKPVAWLADKNWGNAPMNLEESLVREKRLLAEVRIGTRVGKKPGTRVQSVETEESLIRGLGKNYLRLAVTQHLRPTDADVDRLVEAIRDLPNESWIHVHDADGTDRALLFRVLIDCLENAWRHDLNLILERNKANTLLTVLPESDWRFIYQRERAQFIQEFYRYAKAHEKGRDRLWSSWAPLGPE